MRFIVWFSLLAVTALAVSAEKNDDPHDSIIKSIQEDPDPAELLDESKKKKDDPEDSIIESRQADADPMSPLRSTHQLPWTMQKDSWRYRWRKACYYSDRYWKGSYIKYISTYTWKSCSRACAKDTRCYKWDWYPSSYTYDKAYRNRCVFKPAGNSRLTQWNGVYAGIQNCISRKKKDFPHDSIIKSIQEDPDPEESLDESKMNLQMVSGNASPAMMSMKKPGAPPAMMEMKKPGSAPANGASSKPGALLRPGPQLAPQPEPEPGPQGGAGWHRVSQNGPLDEPQKGPLDQPQKGPLDQPQKGPLDQPQKGPMDKPQKGPLNQPQKGPMDQPQKGPLDQPQKGPLDQPQKGSLDQPQKGPLDQPQKGPLDQPQKGPLDQPQKGPMDQPQNKPEQDTTV